MIEKKHKMEVSIISTFDVDVDKIVEHALNVGKLHQLPLPVIDEVRQSVKDMLIKVFEKSVRKAFEDNQFVRPIFSILDETKEKKS